MVVLLGMGDANLNDRLLDECGIRQHDGAAAKVVGQMKRQRVAPGPKFTARQQWCRTPAIGTGSGGDQQACRR